MRTQVEFSLNVFQKMVALCFFKMKKKNRCSTKELKFVAENGVVINSIDCPDIEVKKGKIVVYLPGRIDRYDRDIVMVKAKNENKALEIATKIEDALFEFNKAGGFGDGN